MKKKKTDELKAKIEWIEFAERKMQEVERIRKKKGITRRTLAAKAGISEIAAYLHAHGKRVPKFENLKSYCLAVGVKF